MKRTAKKSRKPSAVAKLRLAQEAMRTAEAFIRSAALDHEHPTSTTAALMRDFADAANFRRHLDERVHQVRGGGES